VLPTVHTMSGMHNVSKEEKAKQARKSTVTKGLLEFKVIGGH
jgi:hypothetical protein